MSKAVPNEHAPSADTLQEQTWVWLRLLTSGQANTQDADRFRRWVRANGAYQAAYSAAKLQWDAVRTETATLLRVAPEVAAYHAIHGQAAYRQQRHFNRRAFVGVAVGAAAAMSLVLICSPGKPPSICKARHSRLPSSRPRDAALRRWDDSRCAI